MMNFHNPAFVRTVTFNFAESYQNVTMLRILMSDAPQHKHVSYIVCTIISLCAHMYMQGEVRNWLASLSVTWNSSSLLHTY